MHVNKLITLIVFFTIISSCIKERKAKSAAYIEIVKEEYELYRPTEKAEAVLVLFGGYPENAARIKEEFNILGVAKAHDIAVLFSNYNRKLWLEENELNELAEKLQLAFRDNELPTDNIYIGGFSSGGNVAFHISNYLTSTKTANLIPQGVFIVDSPIDLAELYKTAEKNVKSNFSEPSVEEGKWIIETFENRFGNPDKDISAYQKHSVFTLKSENIDNIKRLKNTKIRLYTEPDTLWWQQNRMVDYEDMNAYPIKVLSETLQKMDFEKVEYIPTQNRGYRSNGMRHPHSWAIVDENDLIDWMLEK